jgi:hypothetical protein
MLPLVILEVEGYLTPQRLAAICAIIMVLVLAVLSVFLRSGNKLPENSVETLAVNPRAVPAKKMLQVGLLLLFLMVTLWMTKGGPWIPRLIGAFMLLLFTTGIGLRKTGQS